MGRLAGRCRERHDVPVSLASDSRAALADALLDVGPDAPTLCEGWNARDLAAHLVVRERRPDSMVGVVVPPLAGWTERVRREAAARPFTELVEEVRTGPPAWSPFALPGLRDAANTGEFVVHLEDVRRAVPDWRPRELSEADRSVLWRIVSRQGPMLYRHSPVGVVLVVPDGPRRRVRRGDVSVAVTGQPEELLLHAFGRTGHALVEVTGPDDAVDRFRGTPLGI